MRQVHVEAAGNMTLYRLAGAMILLLSLSVHPALANDYPMPWSEWVAPEEEFPGISFRTRVFSYNRFSDAYVHQLEVRNNYDRRVRVSFNMTASCEDEPEDRRWNGGRIEPGETLTLGGSINWFFPTSQRGCVWWNNLRFE